MVVYMYLTSFNISVLAMSMSLNEADVPALRVKLVEVTASSKLPFLIAIRPTKICREMFHPASRCFHIRRTAAATVKYLDGQH